MPRTLFILGTDPGYCAELQDALQAKISDNIVIVTPSSADGIAPAKESDSIIIAGEERDINFKNGSIDAAADAALERLKVLVNRFEDEGTPYRSLVLSMWAHRYGTYDDLARVREWSPSGGAGEEDE